MAVQASAEVVQPTIASAAPNRVGPGGRFATGDRVEGMLGSPFVNFSGQWRAADDGGFGQSNVGQWLLRQPAAQIIFTPLVGLAAATYPATASVQIENGTPSKPSPTDLQHGVGVYEHYMRVTSGSTRGQGSVINRFS